MKPGGVVERQWSGMPIVTTKAKRKIFDGEAPCLDFRGHIAVRQPARYPGRGLERRPSPVPPSSPGRGAGPAAAGTARAGLPRLLVHELPLRRVEPPGLDPRPGGQI